MNFTDQLGNPVSLNKTPQRIVSLVPSQTELLFDLGLDEEVIGITKYCIYPKHWHRTKTKVGGTKKLNIEKIKQLSPDLLIGNKEENKKEQILELLKEFPVWMSDIATLEDALGMMQSMGELTGKKEQSLRIQNGIREQFAHFKLSTSAIKHQPLTILYLIWRKPYICAGKKTFIGHLLEICGLTNAASGFRYPKISKEEIRKISPSFIFLSSEPFPFGERHFSEFQNLCPSAKIILVDGKMFSWYGSRLLYAPVYFEKLLQNL